MGAAAAMDGQRVRPVRAAVCYALLAGLGTLFLLPFLWMVLTSLKGNPHIFATDASSGGFLPNPAVWRNYVRPLTELPMGAYFRNSLLVVVLGVIGTTVSSSLVAFAFGCLEWRGRDFFFVVLLATMMLPPQVTMIPVFILFSRIGWVDTLLPLIVPSFLGANAFFVFLLRQFFKTLPRELFDAAEIDGCSALRIYWHLALPLSMPAMATVVIFTAMGAWNDFLGPLIYLNTEEHKTLALGVQSFVTQFATEYGMLMAVSTIMVVPMLVIFFVGQRYFVEGITLSGLKG
jgi:ABC-type glycerol-3-phosphate transport system permease component